MRKLGCRSPVPRFRFAHFFEGMILRDSLPPVLKRRVSGAYMERKLWLHELK